MSEDALAKTETAAATPTVAEPVASRRAALQKLGRYRIERELGAGGMGVVYAAFEPELERKVALKVLHPERRASSPRLLREARALAKLQHPNVVAVHEVGTAEGHDYVAMELVDGVNLADWLRSEPRTVKQIVSAFAPAARGLAAAHAAGLVHRDFKPHNVLRGKSGRVLVTDFGLAREAANEASVDDPDVANTTPKLETLTVTGSWVGTPAYMAPEQWSGGKVGPATDQFSFCVALWEALAGERPFRGDTVEELRTAAQRGPSALDFTKIPSRFRSLLRRGLDPDPTRRYSDMEMVANLLESHIKSRAWVWWVVIGSLVLGIAVGVYRGYSSYVDERAGEIEAITRFSDGTVNAPIAAIDRIASELGRKSVQLVPSTDQTGPIGLKIFALKSRTALDAIGLANGDILVAIDGAPTRSKQELADALAKHPFHAPEIRLDLLRGKAPFTILVRAKK